MNIVIYARQDMQPITVIDLPMRLIEMGAERGCVQIAVMEPLSLAVERDFSESLRRWTVSLTFHRLVMLDQKTWFITTDDEEAALLLKPDWLPGQRGRINQLQMERDQMAKALVKALTRGLGG